MENEALNDIVEKHKSGEKINLISGYTTSSVAFIKAFSVVSIAFGFLLSFVVYIMSRGDSVVTAIVFPLVGILFALFLLSYTWYRAVAIIQGDEIKLKRLITGQVYILKLSDIHNIKHSSYKAGHVIYVMVQRTSLYFNYKNKEMHLDLLNTNREWPIVKNMSAADIVWVAREGAS